jgi:hypothetical protein
MPRQHHPIADLFPMLAEDELRELAADIKQRGQLQPIMLDAEGSILDGRNRNAACDLAGVEPWFETYEGDDPDGYALSVNVNRREMTKGQKAMVIATAYKNYTQDHVKGFGVSKQYISWARTVREYAPELVSAVIAGPESQGDGPKTLDQAYKVAKERKAASESDAEKLTKLRELSPDLAVLVENDIRELADALNEAGHRAVAAEVDQVLTADEAPEPTFASRAEAGAIGWAEAATLARQWKTERDEQLKRDKARIDAFLRGLTAAMEVRRKTGSQYVTDLLALLDEGDREELQDFVSKIKD